MTFEELYLKIKQRRKDNSPDSYVAALASQGPDRVIQKVGEEAVEVVIAAKNSDKLRLISESADLLFHLLVLWEQKEVQLSDITDELDIRSK
jgi:phosphoribosyl-ATP pyrophosphohydrolase